MSRRFMFYTGQTEKLLLTLGVLFLVLTSSLQVEARINQDSPRWTPWSTWTRCPADTPQQGHSLRFRSCSSWVPRGTSATCQGRSLDIRPCCLERCEATPPAEITSQLEIDEENMSGSGNDHSHFGSSYSDSDGNSDYNRHNHLDNSRDHRAHAGSTETVATTTPAKGNVTESEETWSGSRIPEYVVVQCTSCSRPEDFSGSGFEKRIGLDEDRDYAYDDNYS